MNPRVFLYGNQIHRLLSAPFDLHKGIAFEWADEAVIHAHLEFPEIAPSGLPILAYFKILNDEELVETPENLLSRFEPQLKNHASERVEQVLAVFFHQEGDRKYTIAKTLLKRFNQVLVCQPTLIPADIPASIPEDKTELASLLASKKVLIVGAGSFAAPLAVGLANAGVGKIVLFDFATFKPEELLRHPGGMNDLGRFKTKIVRDLIRQKKLAAQVVTYELDILNHAAELQKEADNADLLICLTNENQSADAVNKLAIQTGKPAFFARALPDAAFGTVFRYIPGLPNTPCLSCLGNFTLMNDNGKINYVRIGDRISAAPVADSGQRQEGVGLDLSPFVHLLLRLAVHEIAETDATISIHPKNVTDAPLFFWANQRVSLPNPQRQPSDDYSILIWHPVEVFRFPSCAVCEPKKGG